MSKCVAYFRVSTARQGQFGLGLGGRKSGRPQLLAMIAQAQREDAVLLVAELDRLARGMAFLAPFIQVLG